MAVGQYDGRFDYCDKLLETVANYNFDECCNIVKNTLKQFKGADKGFIQDVCGRPNSAFSIKKMFFPVYRVTMTVTYDWDVESTEDKGDYKVTTTTHHTNTNTKTKDFFRNIYSSCAPNTFTGRNDQRFYKLSHVNDLDASIYNDSCVYSQSSLTDAISAYAQKEKPANNADYLVNSWTVTVLFIPIAVINYKYGEKNYTSAVNMHNGQGHFEYLVSKECVENAKRAKKISLNLRTASIAVSSINFVISLLSGFWATLFSLALLIVMIVTSVLMKHNEQYFINYFGENGGTLTSGVLSKEITHITCSVIISILLLILF